MAKQKSIYINKKEFEALNDASGYVSNLLHSCSADEETEEGAMAIKLLQDTIAGLFSLCKKYLKS